MVNLNRFSPSSRDDILTLLSATLGDRADKTLRERIRTERILLNLRRARKRLEAWSANTGGAWEVTTSHSNDRWHAQLVTSYKGDQQETSRSGDTELDALEAAMWGALLVPSSVPSSVLTIVVAAVTAILTFIMLFAILWVVFE
jgi:hypothetical protein